MSKIKKIINLIMILSFVCILSGCSIKDISMDSLVEMVYGEGYVTKDNSNQAEISGMETLGHGNYDSKDTAAVSKMNTEKSQITFLNHNTGREYTLDYSEIIQIRDKYNQNISMSQVNIGDVVDIYFQKNSKKLVALNESPQAFSYDNVSDYILNRDRGEISFGPNLFSLDKKLVLDEAGEELTLDDFNDSDTIRVSGVGQTVYSIVITKGHGYLRLEGDDYFLGGWITVGKQIQRITAGMLLTVPEGKHVVSVRNKKHGGQVSTTIYSGEETVLNVEELKGADIKFGKIIFTTTPYDAQIYIDGQFVDKNDPVELEYGVHAMLVKAKNYDTINQYIKINQETANLDIVMEPARSELPEDEEVELPIAGEVGVDNGVYYVHVSGPAGAEVYMDGVYIGVAPTSIEKEPGAHIITLRKDGCQNKSYTIQVNSEKKDLELSFSELESKSGANNNVDSNKDATPAENLLDAAQQLLEDKSLLENTGSQPTIPSTSNTGGVYTPTSPSDRASYKENNNSDTNTSNSDTINNGALTNNTSSSNGSGIFIPSTGNTGNN